MKIAPSERSFLRGLRALNSGDALEALALFEASLKLEEQAPNPARRARYASYYGYCIARALGETRKGLALCRKAAQSEFFAPDVFLNLARVHLMTGSRKEAWGALVKGIRLDPEHEGLKAEIRRMGIRRRPAVPFLERSHPLNRIAGKLASKASDAITAGGNRPPRRARR